ncbi:DUF2842 domain-containing protein [Phenylobacterium sp. J426]|uniref:DUF2842 domain-containing protein n=1 Tax=Phenylobacterium sp. J426 TaxID=2898439 RepID=UPI0021515C73|nr:DUF2842 domain-containing protein [Phenylobacterium sp. J426]MCR5875751.1 DUF2842 domain-containing protein [Phenylobacterium sp. J426]
MTARVRKLIGLFGIVGFLLFYVWAVASIGAFVADHWAAQLAYYGLAGILWGVPILPLITWMNRGR